MAFSLYSSSEWILKFCWCLLINESSIYGKGVHKISGFFLFSLVIYRKTWRNLSHQRDLWIIYNVDYLLVLLETRKQRKTDTCIWLSTLASQGQKTSVDKLQYCQNEVKYLGHLLSAEASKCYNLGASEFCMRRATKNQRSKQHPNWQFGDK